MLKNAQKLPNSSKTKLGIIPKPPKLPQHKHVDHNAHPC